MVCGTTKHPESGESKPVNDRGYSFCNCKNIFYTEWSNIDHRVYNNVYHAGYDDKTVDKYMVAYAKEYFPMFKEFNPKGNSFLDIGCINSTLLDEAASNWEITGLDINPHSRNNHKFVFGNLDDKSTIEQLSKYDYIWMSHVMEHLEKPLGTLKSLYGKLEDGGLMFIAMPDPYFIDWKNTYSWGHWHLREHHIMWNMESFIKECEYIGFECVFKKRNVLFDFICTRDFHLILRKGEK